LTGYCLRCTPGADSQSHIRYRAPVAPTGGRP
jgi:hypothetical protein